jgi:hypothetical protein
MWLWQGLYWAHKIQMMGNHPKERIQHSQHGESLKSRNICFLPILPKFRVEYFLLHKQEVVTCLVSEPDVQLQIEVWILVNKLWYCLQFWYYMSKLSP